MFSVLIMFSMAILVSTKILCWHLLSLLYFQIVVERISCSLDSSKAINLGSLLRFKKSRESRSFLDSYIYNDNIGLFH